MIHLDTNFLIGLVTSPFSLRSKALAWFQAGEKLAISSIVWSEFLNGPVSPQQQQDAYGMCEGRITAFGIPEAEMAAILFNLAGRKRATKTDCFIAASAICSSSALATLNQKDFVRFTSMGLLLA
jgi:predicted nucleic acid-binding protein